MRLIGALLCLAVCATALPAAAFDFSDARHIVALSSPQLSPDGTRIVYVRGVPDFKADRTDRQLWLTRRANACEAATYLGSQGRLRPIVVA